MCRILVAAAISVNFLIEAKLFVITNDVVVFSRFVRLYFCWVFYFKFSHMKVREHVSHITKLNSIGCSNSHSHLF